MLTSGADQCVTIYRWLIESEDGIFLLGSLAWCSSSPLCNLSPSLSLSKQECLGSPSLCYILLSVEEKLTWSKVAR